MSHSFLDRFIEIGFQFESSRLNSIGTIDRWNYYPSWLVDRHFQLITSKPFDSDEWEFRLYTYTNTLNYVQTLIKGVWGVDTDYMMQQFDLIFIDDIRDIKIKGIIS